MKNRIQKVSGLDDKEFSKYYTHINLIDYIAFEAKKDQVFKIIKKHDAALYIIDNISGLCDVNDKDTSYHLAMTFNAVARAKGATIIAIGHVSHDGSAKGWLGKVFSEIGSFAMMLKRFPEDSITLMETVKDRLDGMPTTHFSIDEDTKVLEFGSYHPFPC
jgi:predicted ATP-dependent serine protease